MSDENETVEIEEKDDGYLSFRSSIQTYSPAQIHQVFPDMASSMAPMTAEEFAASFAGIAGTFATHTMKLASVRAAGASLCFEKSEGNRPQRLYSSGVANLAKFAKVLFRPIAISGQASEDCFLDRLLHGDQHLGALENSFESAFGAAALTAVKDALRERYLKAGRAELHGENFPIVYIPGPGGDLQTTPLSAIESQGFMAQINDTAWRAYKAAADAIKAGAEDVVLPVNPFRAMVKSQVSGKARNVALNISDWQFRLRATMPATLSNQEADIWAWAASGRTPAMRNFSAADALVDYATRRDAMTAKGSFSSPAMVAGLNARADGLIDMARDFIDEFVEEARAAAAEIGDQEKPNVLGVLRTLPVRGKDRHAAHAALVSAHFKDRLALKGEI